MKDTTPALGETPPGDLDPIRPWASLTFPGYRLLWVSLLFSSMAFQMGRLLNLWQVYELSGSALQLGLTGLFQAAPLIAFGLLGGTVADAVDRKKLLIVSQVLTWTLSVFLAVVTLSGAIEVWHIYAVTTGLTVVNIVDRPARMSMIPALVPRTHLLNAITLHTSIMQLALLVGPMVAGVSIAWLGAGNAYVIMAAMFVPVIVALVFLVAPKAPAGGRSRISARAMMEGLRFVWGQQIILTLLLLDTTATFFGGYRALMPIFADDILRVGPTGLGLLVSAPALGALVGTGVLLVVGGVRRAGLVVLASTGLYAGSLALFGLSPWFVASLFFAGLLGFWDSFGMSIRQTVLQLATPDHLRGRANGILQIFTMGSPSLGYVQAGIAASLLGASGALVVGAIITGIVVVIVASRWRSLREFTT